MAEQTTITISKSLKEEMAEDKPDTQTWGDFLWSLHENGEVNAAGKSVVESGLELSDNVGSVLEATKEDIERLEDRLEHLPERTADEVEGRLSR